jgi:RNA polymerase sigma-70 factor (ECF subfamily)
MAVNCSLNARRSRRRRRETGLDDPRLELAVAVDAAGHPRHAAALRQTYARLLAALDRLPPPMRTTVVLVTLQGFSHAEAAIVQECAVGTVAWRVFEARRRLRRELETQAELVAAEPSSDLAELLRAWGWPLLAPF